MLKHLIDCAMKREVCDLVIRNARIFNVFTGETECGELAIADGRIVSIGQNFRGVREYDAGGRFALPAFIDAHIHIESSMLSPEEFARLAAAHGTTAIVADPHELVNVCGVQGAEYVKESFSRLNFGGISPVGLYLELPSCVPATPFETSGASLGGKETEEELGRYFGLGEVMNFPAVLSSDGEMMQKLEAAETLSRPIDGHAPALSGEELCAYRTAGIQTDHESLTPGECREKAARGMYVQIRCGSSVNNIGDAAKAIDGFNFRRFLLCSDDKNAAELSQRGHIDDALRRLVAAGLDPRYAVLLATHNIAACYGLKDVGALAPRYFADVAIVDDMTSFRVKAVFRRGVLVAEDGNALFSAKKRYLPDAVKNTVRAKLPAPSDFRIEGHGGKFRVMRVRPHALYTEEGFVPAPRGVLNVKGTSLSKLAVIERHFESGNIGLGLVDGFGFHGGALGLSVAHDSHNLVILGDDDGAMVRVAALLKEAGGGMAIAGEDGDEVFPLDIAGLMSSAPAGEVVERTAALAARARRMGVKDCYEPFMTLAFLSLAVIPELKLTDRGLFSLKKYGFVPLEEV